MGSCSTENLKRMKKLRLLSFIAMAVLLTACGGGKKDAITRDNIVGKWQPEKLEFRGVPKLLKNQIPHDIAGTLLDDDHKEGYLEFKDDGTYVLQEMKEGDARIGKWSFEDKVIKMDIDEIKLSFKVEAVSEENMEIDYVSMFKALVGLENFSIPFADIKMVMTYKRQ